MKIKTKLETGSFLLFIAILLVGAVVYATSQKLYQLQEKYKDISHMTEKIAEMQSMSYFYFLEPNEKLALEWESNFDNLIKLLTTDLRSMKEVSDVSSRSIIKIFNEAGELFKNDIALQNTGTHRLIADEKSLDTSITALNKKFEAMLSGISLIRGTIDNEIDRNQKMLLILLSISFGSIAFFLLMISFSLRKTIVEPLAQLHEAANRIGEGDLEFRSKMKRNDEFGHLIETFNTMAEKLQNFYNDLEGKIQERTKELFLKVHELEKAKTTMAELLHAYQKAKSEDEAILTSVGDGMIVINADEKITFVNQSFEKILGWELSEIKDKNAFSFIQVEDEHGNCLPIEKTPLYQTLKEKKRLSNVSGYSYIMKDKNKVPISVTSSPIIVKNKVIGAVGLLRDVRKEHEIQKMRNELLSFAAHQLRTPLGGVKWNLELLLDGTFGKIEDAIIERIKEMKAINENLIAFVNELLDISRINQGKWNDEPVPTDIIPIIKAVIQEMAFEEESKHLSVYFHGPDTSKVNADSAYFREIMINLLSNAIKYSRENGEIIIEVNESEKNSCITVTDNGIGIPKKDQQKIFSEFFRADNAVLTKTEGTGLGLFMVKSYIEKWGGKVWFTSEEGKFTRIYIELPKN